MDDIIADLMSRLAQAEATIRRLTGADRAVSFHGIGATRSESVILEALLLARAPLDPATLRHCLDLALHCRATGISLISVDQRISKLRKKLQTLEPPIVIERVYAAGWVLSEDSKAALTERLRGSKP
jgi:DNA-binding response OmpR family regulator